MAHLCQSEQGDVAAVRGAGVGSPYGAGHKAADALHENPAGHGMVGRGHNLATLGGGVVVSHGLHHGRYDSSKETDGRRHVDGRWPELT